MTPQTPQLADPKASVVPAEALTINTLKTNTLDQLCINTIRMLAVDGVEKANSGHPGLPMEAAPLAYALWTKCLRHNPKNPLWPNRDRFILSAGHGSMLLYSLLHLTGYDLPLEELKRFRQWGSKTPGHPEYGETPGVEMSTGPLGQGFSSAVGFAMAEAHLAATFNRPGYTVVDHFTYVVVSDGDLMEGVASEAASFAGHLRLSKLICVYLDNRITLEGQAGVAFSEDVHLRFKSYGWHIQHVDGNDLPGIEEAIRAAQADPYHPSLIIARTHIGFGSPHKHDTHEAHGSPLGGEEVKATKENLGWPVEPTFYIPEESRAVFKQVAQRGQSLERDWQKMFDAYAKEHPELAKTWTQALKGELPAGWDRGLPTFADGDGALASRQASGMALTALAKTIPWLMGGSADLSPSTNTYLKGLGDFQAGSYGGRNLHFGVREHAMGAIVNGIALHGGLLPFGATFFVFSDYLRPSIRLAALMRIQVIHVLTHDSIGLGEDGPTHQPIEHLASLRAMPNVLVLRPADSLETVEAWKIAVTHRTGPVLLILSRQKLPLLNTPGNGNVPGVAKGAYILMEAKGGKPNVILMATGSEVSLAVEASKQLTAQGLQVRVVSLPSWELFEQQPQSYKDAVFPPSVTARLAIEAASPFGWHRYVGLKGDVIGMARFGASAPAPALLKEFGFTVDNVVSRARALVEQSRRVS